MDSGLEGSERTDLQVPWSRRYRLKDMGAVRAAVESGQGGPAGELGLSVELEWLQA